MSTPFPFLENYVYYDSYVDGISELQIGDITVAIEQLSVHDAYLIPFRRGIDAKIIIKTTITIVELINKYNELHPSNLVEAKILSVPNQHYSYEYDGKNYKRVYDLGEDFENWYGAIIFRVN